MEDLKFINSEVVFQEIPNEITLAINISGCPVHCTDCHSKFLWENTGTELNLFTLNNLIISNPGITCVCFMGGDGREEATRKLIFNIKQLYPKLKTGWYLGRKTLDINEDYKFIDYLKIGPYIKELGGLDSPTTNQKMYKFKPIGLSGFILYKDITKKFQK